MNQIIQVPNKIEYDFSAIDRAAKLQPSTKEKYKRAIKAMIDAGVNPNDHEQLQSYADTLRSSRKQFLKSALRLSTLDFEQRIKSRATPENVHIAQAAIMRLDAIRNAVQVVAPKGKKAHTWLSPVEVEKITSLCGESVEGKRDWIVLGVLMGAGLRREEFANLKFDDIKTQPTKKGVRTVLEVKGKGAKSRVVPIKDLLARRLEDWKRIAGDGYVARRMENKSKTKLGGSMSAVAIFQLVNRYGRLIGKPDLAPHDLRRTFAQLAYNAGVPITQISVLLGHSSVKTTQGYLDLELDLETTASDFIPLAE